MSILTCEIENGVAVATLNRPERHNALSPELICRLADLFDALAKDDAVRVVVLTGAGDKTFCSGGDLELSLPLLSGARAPETEWDDRIIAARSLVFRASLKGETFPKPVIAAINGHCLAGGFELMLGTDIRIAPDHAVFGLPEAKHALIPFAGALARITRQLPQPLAMEMLLTGDTVPVAKMAAFGLVNRVVPVADVLPTALEIARRIAYVPQAHAPPFPFEALEVVLMGRTARLGAFGQPGRTDRATALDAMDHLGIADLAGHNYAQLSGGQRQLVLIARALAQEAPLIVMDEPTASLDFGNQAQVLSRIAALVSGALDDGRSVVLSTHDPDQAFALDARVVLMHRGGILAQGAASEILDGPRLSTVYGMPITVETTTSGRRVCLPAVT